MEKYLFMAIATFGLLLVATEGKVQFKNQRQVREPMFAVEVEDEAMEHLRKTHKKLNLGTERF